jgi:hypothetical protein
MYSEAYPSSSSSSMRKKHSSYHPNPMMGVPTVNISSDYRLNTNYAAAGPHSAHSLEDSYSQSSGTQSTLATPSPSYHTNGDCFPTSPTVGIESGEYWPSYGNGQFQDRPLMELDLSGSETFHPDTYMSQNVPIPVSNSVWSELPKDMLSSYQTDYLYPPPDMGYDHSPKLRRRSEGDDIHQQHPRQRHHAKSMSTFVSHDGIPLDPLEEDIAYALHLSQLQQHATNGSFHGSDQWTPTFGNEPMRPPTFNEPVDTSVPPSPVNQRGNDIPSSPVQSLAKPTVTSHAMRVAANARTKREPRYQCKYCSDYLTTSAGLRNHVNSHMGKKNFPCTACGKAFVTKWDRKRHEKNLHGLTSSPHSESGHQE